MIESEEIESRINFAKSEPISVFTCLDKENPNSRLWNKNVSKFALTENILGQGVFTKKGKRFNLRRKRYYIITSSYICYKQVFKKKIKLNAGKEKKLYVIEILSFIIL